jgi:hypothetical protein
MLESKMGFAEGAVVYMADGNYKPIQQIEKGDVVFVWKQGA